MLDRGRQYRHYPHIWFARLSSNTAHGDARFVGGPRLAISILADWCTGLTSIPGLQVKPFAELGSPADRIVCRWTARPRRQGLRGVHWDNVHRNNVSDTAPILNLVPK